MKSWLASANDPESDFPIENLPYGVFRHGDRARIGVAIGDRILDLYRCAADGLIGEEEIRHALASDSLNELMALGSGAWTALRRRVAALLEEGGTGGELRRRVEAALVPMREVAMELPARIGDYTDFYASIDHAVRVGRLFRPDQPLLPNYRHLPIGYHGRASSIVVSGSGIRRPCGQRRTEDSAPVFGPSESLDYELEVGILIGPGNRLGEPISVREAEDHIFGLCLVNDWSARDIQAWEYQPLGPFLAKSFATTISPWIVPLEALAPWRVPAREREIGEPRPLAYLAGVSGERAGIDLTLEAYLESRAMREAGMAPERLSRGNLRQLYWTIAQLVAHHTSNGCNLRSGDLLATGTISGPEEGSEGCLLEMRHRAQAVRLATGETRASLADGDRVILRACAQGPGLPRIGFGECAGTIVGSLSG